MGTSVCSTCSRHVQKYPGDLEYGEVLSTQGQCPATFLAEWRHLGMTCGGVKILLAHSHSSHVSV